MSFAAPRLLPSAEQYHCGDSPHTATRARSCGELGAFVWRIAAAAVLPVPHNSVVEMEQCYEMESRRRQCAVIVKLVVASVATSTTNW